MADVKLNTYQYANTEVPIIVVEDRSCSRGGATCPPFLALVLIMARRPHPTLLVLVFIPDSIVQVALLDFLDWIEGIYPLAAAELISITYALALLFMLPGTPWNLAAGYLFAQQPLGVFWATLVALLGANLGALLAFVLGRSVLRDWAISAMRRRPFIGALDRAIDKDGFKLVLLTRLSPLLPFPLLNYLFGATGIPLSHYFSATFLGLIPLTAAYCWVGSELRNLKDVLAGSVDQNPTERYIWLAGAIGGTLLVMVMVTVITRNALKTALEEEKSRAEINGDTEAPEREPETRLDSEHASLLTAAEKI